MDYSEKSKKELIEELHFLKKKEKIISLVLDNTNEIVYHISFDENKNRKFEYISPHVERVMGISTQKYVEDNSKNKIRKYFHPDDLKKLFKQSEKITPKNNKSTLIYRFFNKLLDKYVWIEETIVVSYRKNGEKSAIFGTAKNITEKIEYQQQLSFVLENIEECIYSVKFTANGKILSFVSPHIYKLTGLTIKDFHQEGQSGKLTNRIHPDDVEMVNKNIEVNLYQKQKTKCDTIFRFKPKGKKEYLWIHETIHAVFDKEGNLIETTTVLRDITEQQQQQQLIEASEKRFNILSNATNEVVLIHEKGKILDINNSVKQIFGYNPKELIGRNVTVLAAKQSVEKIKKNIINNNKNSYEAYGLRKDGSIFQGEVLSKGMKFKNSYIKVVTIRDISQQKTIEQYLKENEEKYKTLFTKNLAGVFITEKNTIVDCNNSFAKIFGYKSKVELLGKKATDLYFTKEEREAYLKDLNKKGFLTNYVIRHKNKKNQEIWISTNVYLRGGDKLEGTLVDITEQIKSEQKLKASRENYKKLIDNSPYGTIIHVDGDIFYANPKALQLFGLKSLEELKNNRNVFDFLPQEYQKEGLERRKKALKGEDVPFIEVKIKNPITKKKLIIETKAVKYNYQGKDAIQVFFKDITIEKELSKEKLRAKIAEESNKVLQKEIIERAKIQKKLIENQKYTQSIINSSLDIICACDEKGKIIEFNAAAEHAFGYKAKEILKAGVQKIYAHKKEYQEVGKQLKKEGVFIGEVENKRKNGELFTSFLSASVLYNEEGESMGTMGVSRDISELKEAEQQLIDSEEKYRDLFENATDLIQSVDVKGNILYVNQAWKNALGYSDDEIERKNIFEIIHPHSVDKCKKLFNKITNSIEGSTSNVSYELRTKLGKKINVEGSVSLKFKEGRPHSSRAILRNVTEEIWDKKLQNVYNNIAKIVTEKENPEDIYEGIRIELGKIMDTSIFAISYIYDKDIISFPYYYDVTRNGRIHVETRQNKNGLNEYLIKKGASTIVFKKDWEKIVKKGKHKLYGPSAEIFIGVPLKVKNKVIGLVSVQSYKNDSTLNEKSLQALEFISGVLALTVQRKQDELIIFKQSSRLKSIIENSTHLFWTYDKTKGVTSSNKNFVNYINETYNKKVEIKKEEKTKLRFSSVGAHSFWDNKYEKTFKGIPQYFISKKKNKKGGDVVKEVFLNPIYNSEGKVLEISGIAHDITEKTLSEQKLKESLKEKEVLLKEVHHRVKNNLQVISSILNLQSSYIKDENTLAILKESQNRIKTMAFIHEYLYQTNDFSKINFSEYIVNLSKNLVHSYGILDNLVELKFLVDDVSLNLDLSIPCGLIVNELVSNSLKYAFSDRGIIKIELFENNEEIVNLIVEDNGFGLPKEIDYKNTDSLGLQLVITLVEQISGTIDLDNANGAKYTITFKK